MALCKCTNCDHTCISVRHDCESQNSELAIYIPQKLAPNTKTHNLLILMIFCRNSPTAVKWCLHYSGSCNMIYTLGNKKRGSSYKNIMFQHQDSSLWEPCSLVGCFDNMVHVRVEYRYIITYHIYTDGLVKDGITPWLTQWSYCSLALSHRYITPLICNDSFKPKFPKLPLQLRHG